MLSFSFNTEKATIDDETEAEARIISMVAGTGSNYISIHILITFTIDFGNVTWNCPKKIVYAKDTSSPLGYRYTPPFKMFWISYKRWLKGLNPIHYGGRGWNPPSQTDIAHYAYFCLGHMCWNFLTFPITCIDSVWRNFFFKFWGGTPRTGPLKISKF